MRIEPLGSKVVVKRTEADEVTAGGIVLPDSARENRLKAESFRLATVRCWTMVVGERCKSAKAIVYYSVVIPVPRSMLMAIRF